MLTQEDVLTLSPRGAGHLIRETLLAAHLPPERTAVVDEALDQVLGEGSPDAWRRTASLIWRDAALRAECDRHAGLRTLLRQTAVGGMMEAITDLLAQRCASRQDDAHLIAPADGVLWICDLHFPELVYHLELNEFGCGPGFAADAQVEDLLSQPAGPQALWQRWVRWACAGARPRRAFIAHPRYVGSFPAWGLPLRSARIRPLLLASRRHLPNGPTLVVGAQPALLPWIAGRLPSLTELIHRSRSPDERQVLRSPWSAAGYQMASERDPSLALLSSLTRTGQSSPGKALVEVIRRALVTLIPVGSLVGDHVLRLNLPLRPRLPSLYVTRSDDRLLVDVDGLAAVITWMGLFPYRYHPSGGSCAWSYATVSFCGWQALSATGRWDVVELPLEPSAGTSLTRWIAFPAGRVPDSLPHQHQQLCPLDDSPPPTCDMVIDWPWSPPDAS